jgi:two-component system, NtrC family, response regulator PilR
MLSGLVTGLWAAGFRHPPADEMVCETMSEKAKILVVDDEASIVEVLKTLLGRAGYSVSVASNGSDAVKKLEAEAFDLLISDVRMEPMDGITLLRKAREIHEHIAIIMITAYATVETAVEAMKNGAFDYVCKPFKIDELMLTVQRALSYEHALLENESLKENLLANSHFQTLIGEHPLMGKVYAMVEKVARTDSTILIRGESGTGKELVARALHDYSRRKDAPFLGVNCAALPATLLESELFGYVKGAFTGANKVKKGLFEAAEGGTLLLDEVGSIPIDMQLKLLRVLEEREIRPVGATKAIPVNVRIVAATNEPLEKRIASGQFREDLYYRLSVIPIELPPLRERISDVPLLTRFFLSRMNEKENRQIEIENSALQALAAHEWPGNVRELENTISRAFALCEGDKITLADLPSQIVDAANRKHAERGDDAGPGRFRGSSLKAFLRSKEKDYISYVLQECGGDKDKAAKALGISLATFYRKYGEGC